MPEIIIVELVNDDCDTTYAAFSSLDKAETWLNEFDDDEFSARLVSVTIDGDPVTWPFDEDGEVVHAH